MPTHIPVDFLTYEDVAKNAKVSVSLVRQWANHPRKALRLPIVDLGHRTKRVRRGDWETFKHNHRTTNRDL